MCKHYYRLDSYIPLTVENAVRAKTTRANMFVELQKCSLATMQKKAAAIWPKLRTRTVLRMLNFKRLDVRAKVNAAIYDINIPMIRTKYVHNYNNDTLQETHE